MKKNDFLELYCKKYIIALIKHFNIKKMKLTSNELKQKWNIKEYDIIGYENIILKTIFIYSWINNNNNNKWVIIVHGLNSNKFRSIFFGLIYLRLGYNIIVFDQRNHGESTIKITTMGYCEKYDLSAIVNFLKKNNSKLNEINFYGWSMGTFVIMEYLKIEFNKNKLINSVILDSTICNLNNLYYYYCCYLLNKNFNYYKFYYSIYSYFIELFSYDLEKINPGEKLKILNKLPILFILNKKDLIIPYKMGIKSYKNKLKYENKKISKLVIFDCGHVQGIRYNTNLYLFEIKNFITKIKK